MNIIQDLITRYIDYKKKQDQCSTETIERYKFLIDVFRKFIHDSCPDEATFILYMNKSTYENIFDALWYYIRSNKISSEDTCDLFVSVVKGFYRFLSSIAFIRNDELIKSLDHNMPDYNFLTKYEAFKKRLKQDKIIRFPSKAAPLEEHQIIELKNRCIEDFMNNLKVSNKRQYHTLMTTIMVRLVIYTGLSQRMMVNLDVQDYDPKNGILNINKIKVKLDEKLNEDLTKYLSIRNLLIQKSSRLFVRANGSSIKNMMGSYLGYVLKRKDKAGSVIAVSKFAITKMLKNNIGVGFISDLTGYETGVIMPCIEMSEIGRESEYVDTLFRLTC